MADLTKLDFSQIRADLKEFLKNQSEFTDYDFDGSGLSVLLDVLAYNTQYNAMLAHLNMNETFLDTAQVRSNVVTHAQTIGYVPGSTAASRANIDIVVQGNDDSVTVATIPRGFKFTGKINNVEYNFVNLTAVTAVKLEDNTYRFYDVLVYQGTIKDITYRYDGINPYAKYEVPSDTVDMNTVTVRVYENPNSSYFRTYVHYTNITEVGPDSEMFFYRENPFGKYEIYFGDNYLGVKPKSGSKIVIEYIDTDGPAANNIRTLSASGTIEGLSGITVSLSSSNESTQFGTDKEGIESIRANAPVNFATQDRAVTANDYRVLLLREFDEMQDVSVWGGEDNNPPIYGKVFISPALKSGERATETFNEAMLLFLKGKNIGAITPEVVESEYTRLCLDIDFKYDTSKTAKTVGEMEELVTQVVYAYGDTTLNRFTGIFRHSNLITKIDAADPGIISSVMKVKMLKTFRPNPLTANDYTVTFPNSLYISYSGESVISSNTFQLDGTICRFGDELIEGEEPKRRLFIYDNNSGLKIAKYADVGIVDVVAGVVTIKDIKFDLSNIIEITASPNSYDVSPKYNQLLQLCTVNTTINGELDTVSLLGSTGLSEYTTIPRH